MSQPYPYELPPLPAPAAPDSEAPQRGPALDEVSSRPSGAGELELMDAILAEAEAAAQRALRNTTGDRTSARLQISPHWSLVIHWTRPDTRPWWKKLIS